MFFSGSARRTAGEDLEFDFVTVGVVDWYRLYRGNLAVLHSTGGVGDHGVSDNGAGSRGDCYIPHSPVPVLTATDPGGGAFVDGDSDYYYLIIAENFELGSSLISNFGKDRTVAGDRNRRPCGSCDCSEPALWPCPDLAVQPECP
jgi:hypothetical protein